MRRLRQRPQRFSFFHAVRLLEIAHADRPRIGQAVRPAEEPVRFGQTASLAFEPASISGFRTAGGGRPPRMSVQFLGLLGPDGPMPLHLTQFVRDRERNHGDATLARFLDLFHHRMVCLFYRAWALNEQTVSHDRPDDDWFARYLASLIGLGTRSLRRRDAVSDTAKLFHAGRLFNRTRDAEGLQAVLAGYFGIAVAIHPFVGRWVGLPTRDRCRLGRTGQAGALGTSAIIGSSWWTRTDKFRIRLGPMDWEDYVRLLPGSPSYPRLKAWVRNYLIDPLLWEVQWVLKREQVPATCLGRQGLLGRTSWLKCRPFERDAADLVLESTVAAAPHGNPN